MDINLEDGKAQRRYCKLSLLRQDRTNFRIFLKHLYRTTLKQHFDRLLLALATERDTLYRLLASYSFRNCPIRFAKKGRKGSRLIESAITKNRIFMDRPILKFLTARRAQNVPFVFQFNEAAFYYRVTTRAHPMKNILRVLHLTKNKVLINKIFLR